MILRKDHIYLLRCEQWTNKILACRYSYPIIYLEYNQFKHKMKILRKKTQNENWHKQKFHQIKSSIVNFKVHGDGATSLLLTIFLFLFLPKKKKMRLVYISNLWVGPVFLVDIKLSHATCVLTQATFTATRTSTPKTQTWRTSRWTEAPLPRVRSRCYFTHSDRARHPHSHLISFFLFFFNVQEGKKPQNPSAHSIGSLHDLRSVQSPARFPVRP